MTERVVRHRFSLLELARVVARATMRVKSARESCASVTKRSRAP
jgi:hypothetical protein